MRTALVWVVHPASSGNFLSTFRDNLSVPSSGVKISFLVLLYFLYLSHLKNVKNLSIDNLYHSQAYPPLLHFHIITYVRLWNLNPNTTIYIYIYIYIYLSFLSWGRSDDVWWKHVVHQWTKYCVLIVFILILWLLVMFTVFYFNVIGPLSSSKVYSYLFWIFISAYFCVVGSVHSCVNLQVTLLISCALHYV